MNAIDSTTTTVEATNGHTNGDLHDVKAEVDNSVKTSTTDEPLFDLPHDYKPKEITPLTPEQQGKLEALRAYTKEISLTESDPYYPNEQKWLNDDDVVHRFGDNEYNRSGTLRRYLRAGKWNIEDCKKRIKYTMEWRRDYKPDLIRPEDVEMEAFTGKILILGFDIDGRPMLYLRPSLENTPTSPRQLKHVTFILERLSKLMPLGIDNVAIIADYNQSKAGSTPSVNTGRKTLALLQNNYPERLGRAIAMNLPWFVSTFFKLIGPFMDPVTKDKIRFNVDLTEYVPREQLPPEFKGDYDYEYNHDKYWNELMKRTWWENDGKYEQIPKDTK